MIKLTQLYNEIKIASPNELPNIADELAEAGFSLDDTIITDNIAVYHRSNEMICGDWQNEFYPKELHTWYKNFSKNNLMFEVYSQHMLEIKGVDMNKFDKIENGLYSIKRKGHRQGYIEIFPEWGMNDDGELTGHKMMKMYVVPELKANEIDDSYQQPIFALGRGFRIIPLISETELANKLESNDRVAGMWYII
jgi:hypothetical protein